MTARAAPGTAWDPAQYRRFADHRHRPGQDLLARVPRIGAQRVIDLGCGTGELTAELATAFPDAAVTGLDSSPAMLARARMVSDRIGWVLGDIATFAPAEPFDVVFSNAALQWVPDHPRLLPMLWAAVAPGGVLAIQMPFNFDEPSHRAMREVAARPAFAAATAGAAAIPRLPEADRYLDYLPGAALTDLWITRYLHQLTGEDAVVEWVKGTGLRPFLDVLEEPARTAFLAAYAAEMRHAYPPRADGTTIFPFPRLFIVALKP